MAELVSTVDLTFPFSLVHPDSNSVATAITLPVPTTDEPPLGKEGFFPLEQGSWLELLFVGTDADNEDFDAHVALYATATPTRDTVWVPAQVIRVTPVLSSSVPAVGGISIDSGNTFFADTIASDTTYAWTAADVVIESPADNASVARLLVRLRGHTVGRVLFDLTGGVSTAASANALYRVY